MTAQHPRGDEKESTGRSFAVEKACSPPFLTCQRTVYLLHIEGNCTEELFVGDIRVRGAGNLSFSALMTTMSPGHQ